MSLTHTLSTSAPRLCRRQSSLGVEHHRRAASPHRHMRLVSACAALPSSPSPAMSAVVDDAPATPPRPRSPSVSRAPTPLALPQTICLPSPYVPRTRPGTPRAQCSPLWAQPPSSPTPQSPRSSYFPSAPASPVLSAATPSPVASPCARPPSPPPFRPAYSFPPRGVLPASLSAAPSFADEFPIISNIQPRTLAERARVPDPDARPKLRVESNRFSHTVSVPLPGYTPDEVTISVSRETGLRLVADRWGAAADDKCHLEWLVTFAPHDANMTSIHASFADNTLCITVPRVQPAPYTYASRVAFAMA